jgi:hypothetical protein
LYFVGKFVSIRTRGERKRTKSAAKSERTPAIWRSTALPVPADQMPAIQHGERGLQINWRIFSGLITACLSVVVVLFFATDAFYVHTISVAGLRYLQDDEIFRLADIADTHVFWINEQTVSERLKAFTAIADAEVTLGWPPDMVRIVITEREPALTWEQANVPVWLDLNGRVLMSPPEDRADLLRVVVEGTDEIVTPSTQIPPEVVNGALLLRELIPGTTFLRYHPVNGLGFRGEGGWDAWFGSGLDMSIKILVYQAIVEDHKDDPSLREINVVNPDAPYLCCNP